MTACFVKREQVAAMFSGKSVAVIGSGPGVMGNRPGFVDSHDVVCRVNNYKLFQASGFRTDVHYSFYGTSITKKREHLKHDGVRLLMCKCPDAKFMDSEWHERQNKPHGVDFRYIYAARKQWWFGDVYVPTVEEFVASFDLLDQHVPTTGFSAILAILAHEPRSLYITGFDFFTSGVHNVNERWRPGNPNDPIGHAPHLERAWLARNPDRITFDPALTEIMR